MREPFHKARVQLFVGFVGADAVAERQIGHDKVRAALCFKPQDVAADETRLAFARLGVLPRDPDRRAADINAQQLAAIPLCFRTEEQRTAAAERVQHRWTRFLSKRQRVTGQHRGKRRMHGRGQRPLAPRVAAILDVPKLPIEIAHVVARIDAQLAVVRGGVVAPVELRNELFDEAASILEISAHLDAVALADALPHRDCDRLRRHRYVLCDRQQRFHHAVCAIDPRDVRRTDAHRVLSDFARKAERHQFLFQLLGKAVRRDAQDLMRL